MLLCMCIFQYMYSDSVICSETIWKFSDNKVNLKPWKKTKQKELLKAL